MLVKCDKDTKADMVLSRVSDTDVIEMIENRPVMDYLAIGESQKYAYDVDANEDKFTIDIQILHGNVTFYYGKTPVLNDQTAIYKFPYQSSEEFFTVKFGSVNNIIRKFISVPERRYMMVTAVKDSSYRIIIRRDQMLSTISGHQLRYSS